MIQIIDQACTLESRHLFSGLREWSETTSPKRELIGEWVENGDFACKGITGFRVKAKEILVIQVDWRFFQFYMNISKK